MASAAPSDAFVVSFKLLLIGDTSVGKSSLAGRFISDSFSFSLRPTIGIDFRSKDVVIEGSPIKITLWDTAGEERYRSLAQSYFRGSHGVCAVFDVTSRPSFDNVDQWMAVLRESVGDEVKVVLLGNKADLTEQRVITTSEGNDLARKLGVKYYETSALTAEAVEEAFMDLAKQCYDKYMESGGKSASASSGGFKPGPEGGGQKKDKCC